MTRRNAQDARSCDHCGASLAGRSSRARFCSDACRKAFSRAAPDATIAADIATVGGRARAGLETWLEDRGRNLPEHLVAAARVLADQLDAAPRSSPLWGRYQTALSALVEAREVADRASERFAADWNAEIATIMQAELYRAERCAAAEGPEGRRRWAKLVPIGCARGEHAWHAWPAGKTTCDDCEAAA